MPDTEQNTNAAPPQTQAASDNLQQLLANSIGKYVVLEFLLGSRCLETRAGYLRAVGTDYVAIAEAAERPPLLCKLSLICFATLCDAPPTTASDSANNTSVAKGNAQAAFQYVKRRAQIRH